MFKNTRRQLVLLILVISVFNVVGYESSGPFTLTEPVGTRSIGMGGAGYALADDESALFYNPAGLGIKNERWESGALTSSIGLDLSYWGVVFQSSTIPKIGFSVYWDHSFIPQSQYKESAISAGAGFTFFSNNFISNSAGSALKWYHKMIGIEEPSLKEDPLFGGERKNIIIIDSNSNSNSSLDTTLFPVLYGKNSANAFALDFGYILEIMDQFRIGLSLKNIGPDYHLKQEGKNRILYALPFQTAVSLGYKKRFKSTSTNVRILDFASEITYKTKHNEALWIYNTGDINYRKSSYLQTGIDFCFLKSISARFGYVKRFDEEYAYYAYDLHALSLGIGLSLFNHFEFDFFRQNEYSKYRFSNSVLANQGFSTSYKRAFKWNRSDRKWWYDK